MRTKSPGELVKWGDKIEANTIDRYLNLPYNVIIILWPYTEYNILYKPIMEFLEKQKKMLL